MTKVNILGLFKLVFLLLLVFVITFSCGKQKAKWQGTIEDVDGVTIVKNPKEPMYGKEVLSLEEELIIGVTEGKEEYMFSRINDIDADDEGNIYVAEGISAHIRVFDENGNYLRTMGRKGQGPGEMQMPIYVQITSQNELVVHDYMAQRLSFFSLDGKYLRQKSTVKTGNPFIPIKMDSHGNIIVIAAFAPPPVGGKQLKMYDSNLDFIKMIAKEERDMRRTFDIGKPTWYCDVSPNDNIVWGNSDEYVLQILNHKGKLIKKIIKEHDSIEIAAKDKEMYEKRYAVPVKRGLKIHFRNHYPAFDDIFVDDEEKIFVKTYERIENKEDLFNFDVFDSEGRYIAKIPLKTDPLVWKNHKLYTIEEDEEGYQYVKRYKVTWKI
jgi:hypothetical protein